MNRTGKLIAALPAGVDAFITTNERTCLYLSGFAFSDGAIFVTERERISSRTSAILKPRRAKQRASSFQRVNALRKCAI